jgi:hypothetical protein
MSFSTCVVVFVKYLLILVAVPHNPFIKCIGSDDPYCLRTINCSQITSILILAFGRQCRRKLGRGTEFNTSIERDQERIPNVRASPFELV